MTSAWDRYDLWKTSPPADWDRPGHWIRCSACDGATFLWVCVRCGDEQTGGPRGGHRCPYAPTATRHLWAREVCDFCNPDGGWEEPCAGRSCDCRVDWSDPRI